MEIMLLKNLMVMEHCSGGELFDRISEAGQLSEKVAAGILRQLILALEVCYFMRLLP